MKPKFARSARVETMIPLPTTMTEKVRHAKSLKLRKEEEEKQRGIVIKGYNKVIRKRK